MSSSGAVAVAENLSVTVGGKKVLSGINLRLLPSEVVVLTGPTGAGKTTLLKVLAGIIPAMYRAVGVSGSVTVAGLPPEEAFEEGLSAYVPQDVTAYFIGSRVSDEFSFRGLTCVEGALPEGVGCDSLLHELSDGQLYSLFARLSTLSGAKLVLLDEPTSHVDPWALPAVMESVRRACDACSSSAIIVEHRVWLVRHYADRVLELRYGGLRPYRGVEAYGLVAVKPAPKPKCLGRSVEVRDAWFRYVGSRRHVLRGLNLTVRRGEAVAILGRNGAGKSTLLKLVAGVLGPERGSVLVAGRPFLVPQAPVRWFSSSSVEGELATYSKLWGHEDLLPEVVDAFMLDGLLQRLPHSLSAGEARRLSLALARLSCADVVLLDEPSLGLDSDSLRAMLKCVDRLLERGVSVIAATHDVRLARVFGRTCLLREGVLKCFEASPNLA